MEGVTLERLAFGRQHTANAPQRRIEATIGQGLVHASHFQRRQRPRSQQHRRISRKLAGHTEALQGFQYRRHAQCQAEFGRGQVVRVGQGLVKEDIAVGLAVIVLRLPDLPILAFDRKCRVAQPTGQGVLAWPLQRRQIDRGFDQRTNRSHRIQGAIEASEARLATADQGLHLTAFRAGHQHCRFDLINALAAPGGKTLECLTERRFGFHLQDGVEAGKNPQPFLGQIFLAVILTQLAFDQVEKARERAVGQTAALGDAQRLELGRRHLISGNHALLGQHIQHQIAPLQRPLRESPRVVVGRPLDHANHQRHLVQLQLSQGLAEQILTGQTKTMHRALAVLTEKDLVQVGLKNFVLVVMQLQQQRHHRFGGFAGQAALIGQIEVLDQLLGQGTATLAQLPGGGVDPEGPSNRLERYAVVIEELPILNRHQGFHQIRRHLIKLEQNAVFMVGRIQTTDQQGLKARHCEVAARPLTQPGHISAGEAHVNPSRRLRAFVELKTAGVQLHIIARHRSRSGAGGRALTAIAEGIQFGEKVRLGQFLPDEQLQRPRVDLGRHGPALAGKLLLHHGIQVNGEARQHHQPHQAEFDNPAQQRMWRTGTAFITRTRRSGTSHGAGLYALCPGSTDASPRFAQLPTEAIMAPSRMT